MLVFSEEMTERLYDLERTEPVARYLLMPWADNPDGPNYIDLATNDPGVATFVPKNRVEMARRDGTVWRATRRQNGKMGRVVRQALHPGLNAIVTDAEVESFVNAVGTAAALGEWRLVEGEDIRRYYHEKTYRPNSGSLNSSCMRYESHQKFFDLYVKNPEQIKLLVLLDADGLLRGRALVWCYPDGGRVMDRAYGSDRVIRGFEEYARAHGWHQRNMRRSAYNSSAIEDANGDDVRVPPLVIPNWKHKSFPYLDTFGWYDPAAGTLQPYPGRDDDRLLTLHNTQGNDHAVWRKREGVCPRCGDRSLVYVGTSLVPMDVQCDCAQCPHCGFWGRKGKKCACRVCEGCGVRGQATSIGRKYFCDRCYENLSFCTLCGDVAAGTEVWTHGALVVCDRCLALPRASVEQLLRDNFRVSETCACDGCVEMRRQRDATLVEWERRHA